LHDPALPIWRDPYGAGNRGHLPDWGNPNKASAVPGIVARNKHKARAWSRAKNFFLFRIHHRHRRAATSPSDAGHNRRAIPSNTNFPAELYTRHWPRRWHFDPGRGLDGSDRRCWRYRLGLRRHLCPRSGAAGARRGGGGATRCRRGGAACAGLGAVCCGGGAVILTGG
jgi:hypothetical protein